MGRHDPVTDWPGASGAGRRAGRPTLKAAAQRDTHSLDAAERLFIARGYEGFSTDQYARAARAGERTIYARAPRTRRPFSGPRSRARPTRRGAWAGSARLPAGRQRRELPARRRRRGRARGVHRRGRGAGRGSIPRTPAYPAATAT